MRRVTCPACGQPYVRDGDEPLVPDECPDCQEYEGAARRAKAGARKRFSPPKEGHFDPPRDWKPPYDDDGGGLVD